MSEVLNNPNLDEDSVKDLFYKEKIVDILMAEYNVLRGEINLYHQQQKLAINYLLLTIGALTTIILTILEKQINGEYIRFVFLIFPIFILLIASIYVDKTIRIKRIASYISSVIRPSIIEILNDYHILNWEIYKKVTSELKEVTTSYALTIDKARLYLFALPIVISYIVYFIEYSPTIYTKGHLLDLTLLIIGLYFMLILTKSYDSIEETKGAHIEDTNIFNAVTNKSIDITIKATLFKRKNF